MEKFAAKSLLRKQIRQVLRNLSPQEIAQQSQKVTSNLLKHPKYATSDGVAVFISLKDEIDTTDIVKDIFTSGKRCYIPRYSEGGNHMTMVRLHSMSELENLPKSKWNIPQPSEDDKREDALETGGVDLILTPGLAFTVDGCRLGRGKGYYDYFLSLYQQKFNCPYKLGLALSQSIVEAIPCTESDVKLDEILYAKY